MMSVQRLEPAIKCLNEKFHKKRGKEGLSKLQIVMGGAAGG